MAAAARGILTQGVSPAHLRDDLQQWLDLRLKDGVPSTLLVLSNAYAYGREKRPDSHIDNLRATLSCLTDELVAFLNSQGSFGLPLVVAGTDSVI